MAHETRPPEMDALLEHAEGLRRVARGLVRDAGDADDLVQEAALLALRGRATAKAPGFGFWAGVLRNLSRRERRGSARREQWERGAARSERVADAGEAVARLEIHHRILDAVRALPEPSRTAIALRYYEGLPPRAIARRLGIPLETVKSRLKRGLSALRRDLDRLHGGNRRPWLGALVAPVGTVGRGVSAGGLLGGAMKVEMLRRTIVIPVVLLLLGAGAWGLSAVLHRGAASPLPLPGERPLARVPAETPDATDGTTLRGAATRETRGPSAGEDSEANGSVADASTDTSAGTAFVPTVLEARAFASAPPAQVASPIGLPRPAGRAVGLGPAGGAGPTGHWTRFFGLPPRGGPAALSVLVLDEAGHAVANAVVYLAPRSALDVDAQSFGDLRTLGTTDDDGRLDVGGLPEGAGAVCANLFGRLNTPRGLDVRHAAGVLLSRETPFAVRIELPLDVGAMGTVLGRVLDAHGAPIRAAAVATAHRREWSDADGSFRLEGIPAGAASLTVGATGRRTTSVEVTVPPAGTAETTVTLAFADSGSVRIEGSARLPDGTPVPHAAVYLMETGARGTLRSTATDAAGGFVLEDLPDRVRDHAVTIQVSGFPRYRTGLLDLERGIEAETVEVEVPGAYTRIALTLRDDATGALLRVADVHYEAEDGNGGAGRVSPLVLDRDTGVWKAFVEGTRGRLVVDTLSHGAWSRSVAVPQEGAALDIEAKLRRVAPDPVEVALELTLLGAVDDESVPSAKIVVLPADGGEPLARFEGSRADGRYRLPVPSGSRRVRVTADGYEPYEESVELDAAAPEAQRTFHLRPK